MGLEELEKIYSIYHGDGKTNNYFVSTNIQRDKNSGVPILGQHSLFFNCYDDSVYDSVLDDQRKEYLKIIKESKIWHYGQ